MISNALRKTAAWSVLAAFGSLLASPTAVLAQQPTVPQLHLKASGRVDTWNVAQKKWVQFDEGYAHKGDTFRAIEGGSLTATVEGEGPSTVKLLLHSCSAIRFVALDLRETGNTIYGKCFGLIDAWESHDRVAIDDIKLEFPLGVMSYSKNAPPPVGTDIDFITSETPTAAELLVAPHDINSDAKLQACTHVRGTVVSLNPDNGTFVIKEDDTGKLDTVTCRYWTQVARHRLNERVKDETEGEMVQSLKIGEEVTVYGVPTAGIGSLPAPGFAAVEPSNPINWQSTVLYPPGGQYIFGGVYVLSSPTVPTIGPGVITPGANTLDMLVNQLNADILEGIHIKSMACEIGAEVFVVVPPPPFVAAAGVAGGVALYSLLGIGAVILVTQHHGTTNLPPASP